MTPDQIKIKLFSRYTPLDYHMKEGSLGRVNGGVIFQMNLKNRVIKVQVRHLEADRFEATAFEEVFGEARVRATRQMQLRNVDMDLKMMLDVIAQQEA